MIRRWLLAAGVLTSALLFLCLIGFTHAGTWLVVADPLSDARAVVVFGGHVPFRAMEAARIYRQGWTHEVWLTQGGVSDEDAALVRLSIERPAEYIYSRQVLERLGVPHDAIRVLNERNVNTANEVRSVARELRMAGGNRVILVTSRYHTRRVRVLWHSLVGDSPQAIVRYAGEDPFQPGKWWRNSEDAMSVTREWFGLLNAWTGFPVKSDR